MTDTILPFSISSLRLGPIVQAMVAKSKISVLDSEDPPARTTNSPLSVLISPQAGDFRSFNVLLTGVQVWDEKSIIHAILVGDCISFGKAITRASLLLIVTIHAWLSISGSSGEVI